MPNTLCHIGVQAPLNSCFTDNRALIWVLAGILLPDIPWVSLKILLSSNLLDPYTLRLYFTAQASLFFCLLLAASISLLFSNSRLIFIILAANSFFHLLLDCLQIKWGNGVHFLAPINWELFRLDLMWPEHYLNGLLTLIGFFYLLFKWREIVTLNTANPWPHAGKNLKKLITATILFLSYLMLPLCFSGPMEKADTYYINTMQLKNDRPGKVIEFDRAEFSADSATITIYSGEELTMQGNLPKQSGRVSFKGYFVSENTVFAEQYHQHHGYRDLASVCGLFLTCTLLLQSLVLPGLINKH